MNGFAGAISTVEKPKPTHVDVDLVSRVMRLTKEGTFSDSLTIDMQARELNVSRRRLYMAFENQLGFGPWQFREHAFGLCKNGIVPFGAKKSICLV